MFGAYLYIYKYLYNVTVEYLGLFWKPFEDAKIVSQLNVLYYVLSSIQIKERPVFNIMHYT